MLTAHSASVNQLHQLHDPNLILPSHPTAANVYYLDYPGNPWGNPTSVISTWQAAGWPFRPCTGLFPLWFFGGLLVFSKRNMGIIKI